MIIINVSFLLSEEIFFLKSVITIRNGVKSMNNEKDTCGIINVHNEWDQLEEIIVGSIFDDSQFPTEDWVYQHAHCNIPGEDPKNLPTGQISQKVIDETKGLIIPGVEVLGEETNQELIDEITGVYADLVLDGKNYKTLPRLATKYVAEKAGVPEAKIVDPKKNLSSGEYSAAANFLASIADTYIKILPEGAITQDAASEALKGTSTGVPKNVLNFAYNNVTILSFFRSSD